MQNFGIFFNPYFLDKQPVFKLLKELHKTKKLNLFKFPEQKNLLPDFIDLIEKPSGSKLDCILSFGGDGTLLRASQYSLAANAPLLGINLGKLGFLSESNITELEKSIDDLKNNKFKVQKRMLLKAVLKRNNKIIFSNLALNDAVIYKGETPKLIDIRFYSNRRFVVETRCDGIIVSTPTGSTAYSLSAGGPILSPVMEAIIVSPLNPHILSVRPMVFSPKDKLSFMIKTSNGESILQLDGRNIHMLQAEDEIIVTGASQKVSFIKLTNKTFYQILRKKLHMGKR
jgi:NAD+ kinase